MRRVLLVFVLIVSFSYGARAQWEQLPGPYGGGAYSFAYIPHSNRVYAGTSQSVLLSTDYGNSWHATAAHTGIYTNLLRYDSTNEIVFAAQREEGTMFRTTDGGATWQDVFHSQDRITSIVQSRSSIFMRTDADTNQLLRSTDLGNTWQALPSNMDGSIFENIGACHGYLFQCNSSVYRIADTGGLWTKTTMPRYAGNGFQTIGDTLFSFGFRGISYTTDAGATWQSPANENLRGSPESFAVGNGIWITSIKIGSFPRATFRSTDHGESWSCINGLNGFPRKQKESTIEGMVFTDSGFVVGNSSGFTASANGNDWHYATLGVSESEIYDLISYKNTLFAATPTAVYQSSDHGENWSQTLLSDSLGRRFFVANSSLYITSDSLGLWKLDGSNVKTVSDRRCYAMTAIGDTLFGSFLQDKGNPFGVFSSTDNGISWSSLNSNLPYAGEVGAGTAELFAYDSRLFVVNSYYDTTDPFGAAVTELWTSSDEGLSWSFATGLEEFAGGCQFAIADSMFYLQEQGDLLRSADRGTTWEAVSTVRSPSFVRNAMHGVFTNFQNVLRNQLLYVANEDTVTSLGPLALNSEVQTATNDDQFIYLGTSSRGIWRAPIASLPLAVEASSTIGKSGITIYPNPSTDKATLSFSLPERAHISVDLYDACGILRSPVFDGEREAGENNVAIETQGLVNGVYEVVLSTAISRSLARLVIAR